MVGNHILTYLQGANKRCEKRRSYPTQAMKYRLVNGAPPSTVPGITNQY